MVYPDLFDFVSREVEEDADSMKQTREAREEEARRKTGSACVWVRLRSPCLASSLCVCALSLFKCLQHPRLRRWCAAPHAICCLSLCPFGRVDDGHRALGRSTRRRLQRRLHRIFLENEVVDPLISFAESRQAQAASRSRAP